MSTHLQSSTSSNLPPLPATPPPTRHTAAQVRADRCGEIWTDTCAVLTSHALGHAITTPYSTSVGYQFQPQTCPHFPTSPPPTPSPGLRQPLRRDPDIHACGFQHRMASNPSNRHREPGRDSCSANEVRPLCMLLSLIPMNKNWRHEDQV